jgi:ATP-dependent Clp protease ATP-binding subunit ClpA
MRGFNFTEQVRRVLAGARAEAERLHHEYVAPEHMLLSLLHGSDDAGLAVLRGLGVDPEALAAEVEQLVPVRSARTVGPDLPYTSRAKKVIELAMAEVRQLEQDLVGTGHLLLGLIHEERSAAAVALADAGVTLAAARDETRRLAESGEADGRPATPWTRLPGRVRAIITQAHGVALSCGRPAVTAEDAAAALLTHGEGMANAVLDRLGVDRERAIASFNGRSHNAADGAPSDAAMTLAPDLVAALDAMRRSQRDGRDPQTGTQHLLLGILAVSPHVTAVLAEQHITADEVQRLARQMSG